MHSTQDDLDRRVFLKATAGALAIASASKVTVAANVARSVVEDRTLTFFDTGYQFAGVGRVSPSGDVIAFAAGSAERHRVFVTSLSDYSPQVVLDAGSAAECIINELTFIDAHTIGVYRTEIDSVGRSEEVICLHSAEGFGTSENPDTTSESTTVFGASRDGTTWHSAPQPRDPQKTSYSLLLDPSGGSAYLCRGPAVGIDQISLSSGETTSTAGMALEDAGENSSGTYDHQEFAGAVEPTPGETVLYSVDRNGQLRAGPTAAIDTSDCDVVGLCAGHGFIAYQLISRSSGDSVLCAFNSETGITDSLQVASSIGYYLRPTAMFPDGKILCCAVYPADNAQVSKLAIW